MVSSSGFKLLGVAVNNYPKPSTNPSYCGIPLPNIVAMQKATVAECNSDMHMRQSWMLYLGSELVGWELESTNITL